MSLARIVMALQCPLATLEGFHSLDPDLKNLLRLREPILMELEISLDFAPPPNMLLTLNPRLDPDIALYGDVISRAAPYIPKTFLVKQPTYDVNLGSWSLSIPFELPDANVLCNVAISLVALYGFTFDFPLGND